MHGDERPPNGSRRQFLKRTRRLGKLVRLRKQFGNRELAGSKKTAEARIVAIGNAVAAPCAQKALAMIEHAGI